MAAWTFDASSSETHEFQTALCSFRYLNAPCSRCHADTPEPDNAGDFREGLAGQVCGCEKAHQVRRPFRHGGVYCNADVSLAAIGLPPSITVPLSTTELNHVAVSASAVST